MLAEGRETIGTTLLNAEPDAIVKMPGDSWAPFWLSLFLFLLFACLLAQAWWAALAMTALAAGSLLVQEAGGLVGDFAGESGYFDSGEIVAGNPKVFAQLLALVSSV